MPANQKQKARQTQAATRPAAGQGQENEPWIVKRRVNRTWIEYNPQEPSGLEASAAAVRSRVRKHAAAASAAARKATIAKKEAARRAVVTEAQSRVHQQIIQQFGGTTDSAGAGPSAEKALDVLRNISGDAVAWATGDDESAIAQLLDFVGVLQEGRDWFSGGLKGTSLAQRAIRTMLWDAYANIDTLFQAALFVSGTHSNSCGLPPRLTAHMGSGLLLLRGASLEAIQTAVVASDTESSTPVAIALLAGWERRFGDRESYEVHMGAWRRLALPQRALEENHVSTLTDVTLEIFREKLDERSFVSPGDIRIRHASAASHPGIPVLPPGFKVFHTGRPEARSLLMLMAAMSVHKHDQRLTIPIRRQLGLEIIAWNPTHTLSVSAIESVEEALEQLELMALYHVRAALISINGVLLQLCMDTHGVKSLFNIQLGMDVHCMSCQHLNTRTLMGTKYQELGFWARYILCSISRDPDRDDFIRFLMQELKLATWKAVRAVLERHMDLEPAFTRKCKDFYQILTANPEPTIHELVG